MDGSKVLGAILPEDKYFKYMQYEKYGAIILMALLYLGVLDTPLGIFRSGMDNIMSLIVSFIFRLN
ncbi:MAG: peptidase [Clostridiales bacterium]|nr:peptidase [Clostridiales bacterium]